MDLQTVFRKVLNSLQRMTSEKCVENGCVWPFLPSVPYDWSFLCSVLEDNILEKLTQMRAFANPVFKCVQGPPSQSVFLKHLWNRWFDSSFTKSVNYDDTYLLSKYWGLVYIKSNSKFTYFGQNWQFWVDFAAGIGFSGKYPALQRDFNHMLYRD